MSYTEWPNHPDIPWMKTLIRQQEGLGEVNMKRSLARKEATSLWAQKDLLQRQAREKRNKLKSSLRKGRIREAQEEVMSHIAPPPPVPIYSPENPVPGISPQAVVAVADLNREKNRVIKDKIKAIAQNAARRANIAQRVKEVPGITQMMLNPRRKVNLPQPTWNYLSTQGIITPGGIITPVGSYVEAGPSEAFGGFGFTPVLRPASTVLTTASAGLPAIAQTPNFTGASAATQQGSSMAQASALRKECEDLQAKVKKLEDELTRQRFSASSSLTGPFAAMEAEAELVQKITDAKAQMHQKCAQAQQALADAKAAMANPSDAPSPNLKRISTNPNPRVKVNLTSPTPVTNMLPDNTLLTTAGGTVVTEAGDEPGIVISPNGTTEIVTSASTTSAPASPSAPAPASNKILPLLVAAGVIGGGIYLATRARG
ncbi:hypothetical protein DRH13_00115 [Candidatus Woesebacteria bacterium]|nr:MAG: hypothetical protein DRH13_00115 [Candidatus Woesebacteria bacterium]